MGYCVYKIHESLQIRMTNLPVRVLILILAVATTLIIGGCRDRAYDGEQVAPGDKLVIRFSHVTAENSPKGLAAQRFADLIRYRSQNQVEVQVFADSVLYQDGEEIEALRVGKVEMIAPATSKLAGLVPEWQVIDLPYLFSSVDQLHRFLDSPHGADLYSRLEEYGVKPLAFWDNGFKQLTSRSRPLIQPSDCAGLRFRVMINNQVLVSQFSLLGAEPVPLLFSEVSGALEEAKVDGQENTLSNIYSKRLYTHQPYITISDHGYLGYVVLANAEFWESLPGEVRELLEITLAEVTLWEHREASRMNAEDLVSLAGESGIQIHYQTAEERAQWFEKLAPSYSLLKHQIGAELVDAVVAAAAEGGGGLPGFR